MMTVPEGTDEDCTLLSHAELQKKVTKSYFPMGYLQPDLPRQLKKSYRGIIVV